MPTRLIEWFARTLMLVLAGLVTLSILGAIAAIPADGDAGGFLFEKGRDTRPVPSDTSAPTPEPAPVPGPGEAPSPATDAGETVPAPEAAPAAPDDPAERWLEAIAYALLALAGLMALGLVLLALAVRQLRRIADAAGKAGS